MEIEEPEERQEAAVILEESEEPEERMNLTQLTKITPESVLTENDLVIEDEMASDRPNTATFDHAKVRLHAEIHRNKSISARSPAPLRSRSRSQAMHDLQDVAALPDKYFVRGSVAWRAKLSLEIILFHAMSCDKVLKIDTIDCQKADQ